jgi:hypothetical protein
MKILFYLAINLFFLFSNLSLGAEFNPKTHFYQIEYTKGLEDGPRILNMIFNSPIEPSKAEELLYEQINQAVKYERPKTDIMAYAWYQEPDQDLENSIKFKDGSSYLIYVAKTGNIQTAKIYEEANLPQPSAGKKIDVSFDIRTERNSDGKYALLGKRIFLMKWI